MSRFLCVRVPWIYTLNWRLNPLCSTFRKLTTTDGRHHWHSYLLFLCATCSYIFIGWHIIIWGWLFLSTLWPYATLGLLESNHCMADSQRFMQLYFAQRLPWFISNNQRHVSAPPNTDFDFLSWPIQCRFIRAAIFESRHKFGKQVYLASAAVRDYVRLFGRPHVKWNIAALAT